MRLRRLAALVGLAVVAVALVGWAAPAQTGGCVAVNDLDEMTVQIGSPVGSAPRTSPSVPIEVQATNTSSRKTLPTESNPAITRITARLVSCRDGQVLPEEAERSVTGAADSLTLSWTPEPIPTNGPFAVELEITGNRSGTPAQSSRVVVPFSLAVAPHRPNGVTAAPSTDGGVTVSWVNSDREPDLLFYEVQRTAQGTAKYLTVNEGVVSAATGTLTDRPGSGAWRYRVLAIRRGAAEDEGIRSIPSNEVTAEVSSPSPTTSGPSGAGTPGGSGAGTGSETTTGDGSPGATGTTLRPGAGGTGTVDLSTFAAGLNARRQPGSIVGRVQPPDPGFSGTLPFRPPATAPLDELATEDVIPQELGAEQPNQGLGQRPIADPGDRRRSLGFVAFGLLLFVLSMTGLFLRSEVNRVDDLEGLEPVGPVADDAPPALVAPAAATPVVIRRRRRTTVTSDAPSLDIPDPPTSAGASASAATRTRTRNAANARRTPTRLPPRPAGDRRQGDPAVRPRRRRAGEGDRRLPVG